MPKKKGRIFMAKVVPVLLYGAETWTMSNEDVQKVCTFYMRCVRTMARVRWQQHIRDEEVLVPVGIKDSKKSYYAKECWNGQDMSEEWNSTASRDRSCVADQRMVKRKTEAKL
eukprot:Selendium_serpulae@DN6517_c2_g1_i16.p3